MVWIGSIFIKEEGGFEIIMRALNHYNKRLRRISATPEIGEAGAMFGSILESESAKTIPKLKPLANKLRAGLVDYKILASISDDLDLIQKAMVCYKSDAQKALDGVPYYTELVSGNDFYESDVKKLDDSMRRLAESLP